MENEILLGKKILIVEDDISSRLYLNKILERTGVVALSACDGREAVAIASRDPEIDLILMDIQLPIIDGYEAAAQIRKFRSDVIIIAQTAYSLSGEREKVISSGFDDYIVKPFSVREVVARIKAVLRRTEQKQVQPQPILRFEGLEINASSYDVRVDGKSVPLTPKEVEILYLLASQPGRVFDREQILAKVWGYDYFGDTRAVDTQIKRIRQKLPQDSVDWGIKTVYGIGYKFETGK